MLISFHLFIGNYLQQQPVELGQKKDPSSFQNLPSVLHHVDVDGPSFVRDFAFVVDAVDDFEGFEVGQYDVDVH
jgi:hypothetical protein